MKRRRFLTILGSTATITIVGAIAWRQHWHRGAVTQVHAHYMALKNSKETLIDAPTGSLTAQTLSVLLATTEALLHDTPPKEMSHYEDFFRWHAEHLSGYKRLYEQFAATVDQIARKSSNITFADNDIVTRKKILAMVAPASSDSLLGKLGKFQIVLFGKEQLLFYNHIVHEIFRLFARTDALILVGYEAWPGQPRGLDNYRQLPGKAKAESARMMSRMGGN